MDAIEKLRPLCDCPTGENMMKSSDGRTDQIWIHCSACGTRSEEAIQLPMGIRELTNLIDQINDK